MRGCVDWSERELHLAGALGAAVTERLFQLGWISRREGNRSVALTRSGHAHMKSEFDINIAVGA